MYIMVLARYDIFVLAVSIYTNVVVEDSTGKLLNMNSEAGKKEENEKKK